MKKELKRRSSKLILLSSIMFVSSIIMVYLVILSIPTFARDRGIDIVPVHKEDIGIVTLSCHFNTRNNDKDYYTQITQTLHYENNILRVVTMRKATIITGEVDNKKEIIESAQAECKSFEALQDNYPQLRVNCDFTEKNQIGRQMLRYTDLKRMVEELPENLGWFKYLSKYDQTTTQMKSTLEKEGYTCN